MSPLLTAQLEFAALTVELFNEIARRGLRWKYGEAMRSDEQAVINAYGPTNRDKLAVFLMEEFPALALAIKNNVRTKSPLLTTHGVQLAIDVQLFTPTGEYLSATPSYEPVGLWWEKQHALARWGGRFGDGNHFSFEWRGVK